MANSLSRSRLVDRKEAETNQEYDESDDDLSSNSYMDSLFAGSEDVVPGLTEQQTSNEKNSNNHYPNTSQQRQQQLMQHQMRVMMENSKSASLQHDQHHPLTTSTMPTALLNQHEAQIRHQWPVLSDDPIFAQPGVVMSSSAYRRPAYSIDVSEVGPPAVLNPMLTREPVDSNLLLDNTSHYTPLARLYAMAGEYFPSVSQESRQQKRSIDCSIADIPVTCMSPSLVISTLNAHRVSKKAKTIQRTGVKSRSPDQVLREILQSKGLPLYRVCSVEAKYDTLPSPLQLASYGTAVMKALVRSDVAALDALLQSGLSPNPCNQFRDSLLDYVCETSNTGAFECFMRHNAEIRVCDASGRTPLHYCAWSDKFNERIIRSILEKDPQQLFQEDRHGRTPLEVASESTAQDWVDFLLREKDSLFRSLPPLTSMEHRVQLSDPPNPLPVDKAKVVSSGKISPEDLISSKPSITLNISAPTP